MPVLLTRNVSQRDIDYDDLTRTHELVLAILEDQVGVVGARAAVARINSTGHYLPRWAVVLGSGVVGGGIALILGGGVVVTAVAAVAGPLITMMMRTLNRQRWPMFYQQGAGGMLATVLALLTAAVGERARPARGHLPGDHRQHRAAALRDRLHGCDPGRAQRLLPHLRCADHRGDARDIRTDRRGLRGAGARAGRSG